ncbi:2-amino-4-hydroxy-6-hydroxymethyldihydropteridinediphosphokinase [soil metagenome]
MARVMLSLGSNLGDRDAHLAGALEALRAVGLHRVSQVYETEPVGGPHQEAFLNVVAELDTDLSLRELLAVCHRLEAAAGRVRDDRWGPRTLDVDIVWADGISIDAPDLKVPHPRMYERRFVLAPLRELAPDLVTDEQLRQAEGYVRVVDPPRFVY